MKSCGTVRYENGLLIIWRNVRKYLIRRRAITFCAVLMPSVIDGRVTGRYNFYVIIRNCFTAVTGREMWYCTIAFRRRDR